MRPADLVDDRTAYFAYGSNLSRTVMEARCAGAVVGDPARLDGWELCFRRRSRRWGGHAADLRERPHATTWGVLWWVDQEGWEALDRYEAAYRRAPVEVMTDGGPREATTYVVAEPDGTGAPVSEYRAAMLTGAREHALPEAWCASLEAVECLPGGRHLHIDDEGPVI